MYFFPEIMGHIGRTADYEAFLAQDASIDHTVAASFICQANERKVEDRETTKATYNNNTELNFTALYQYSSRGSCYNF